MGHNNVARVRKLLHFLGIGQERLVEQTFLADQKEELVESLWDFTRRIEALGPNPAKAIRERMAS